MIAGALFGVWLLGAAIVAALLAWDDPIAFFGYSPRPGFGRAALGIALCLTWPAVAVLVLFGLSCKVDTDDDDGGDA